MDRLTNEYFARPTKRASAGPRAWFVLTVSVGPQLPAETRTLWAGKLREAFAGLPGAVGSLKGEDMVCLAKALKNLGDNGMSGLLADWARADAPGVTTPAAT